MNGRLKVVRLFIQEFKWNIHQKNIDRDLTPLCYAVQHFETAHFLLENGANINQGGAYGPLWYAVDTDNLQITRLLLEYHADPNLNRRPADEESDDSHAPNSRTTDLAISQGNEEILRMLLQRGAFIGNRTGANFGTSLNLLLRSQKSRETKLTICRVLIEHQHDNNEADDHVTSSFIQASFEFAIKHTVGNACCHQILLDAGMDTRLAMYCAIRANGIVVRQLLVREYQVDPFLEDESNENEDNNNDDEPAAAAASPFLAAARLANTNLLEYFLGIWNERFASTSGNKNSNGDYPIHVVCCDPLVSLQTIIVLVNRHADALAVVDGQQGLLPFQFAANWGASLDVIFYLLQHCPNALCHGGNALAALAATDVSGSKNDIVDTRSGPAKKKAKTIHTVQPFLEDMGIR